MLVNIRRFFLCVMYCHGALLFKTKMSVHNGIYFQWGVCTLGDVTAPTELDHLLQPQGMPIQVFGPQANTGIIIRGYSDTTGATIAINAAGYTNQEILTRLAGILTTTHYRAFNTLLDQVRPLHAHNLLWMSIYNVPARCSSHLSDVSHCHSMSDTHVRCQ